jgi:hypothetical protein
MGLRRGNARAGLRKLHYTSPALASERALHLVDEAFNRVVERSGGMSFTLTVGILRQQRQHVESASNRGGMVIARTLAFDRGQQTLQVPRDVGDANQTLGGGQPLHVLQLRDQDFRGFAGELIGHIGGMHRHQGFVNECGELVSSDLGHE